MMIQAGILILATSAALTGPVGDAENLARTGATMKTGGLVSLIDEVAVPAREPGVLDSLEAKEGLEVVAGTVLGHIDDTEARMELAIAGDEYEIAKVQAGNDVSVRLATKAAWVAWADWKQVADANRQTPGAVSLTEERGKLFEYERAKLAIEEAGLRYKIDGLTAQARTTQLKAAEAKVKRREIHSPIDGLIVEVLRHAGEWVTPGDPIFRIIGLKQMRVEGALDPTEFNPSDVSNRPVTVTARLPQGAEVTFRGKIVFVDPRLDLKDDLIVWAEVENRQENDQWLLLPGMTVTMTIELRDSSGLGATPNASTEQTADRRTPR